MMANNIENDDLYDPIKQAITDGIAIDIYRAEEAIHLFSCIANHNEFLNKDRGYGNLAGTLQNNCIATLVLALARIYDEIRGFDLRNLTWVVQKLSLETAATSFPDVKDFDERVNAWTMELLQIRGDHADGLCKLRSVRDKRLAHNELIEEFKVKGPTWLEVEALLQEAQQLTGDIAFSLFSIAYTDDKDCWLPSFDAQKASASMCRVIEVLQKVNSGNDREEEFV
jgi:hypothetical protein